MIEKMMDSNIIDYYIINCAIPSIITNENRYQIDFGKPAGDCKRNVWTFVCTDCLICKFCSFKCYVLF